MTGQRELICPFCGRNFGVPLETTFITGEFVRSYAPVSVECDCGATWALNIWGGHARKEKPTDGN